MDVIEHEKWGGIFFLLHILPRNFMQVECIGMSQNVKSNSHSHMLESLNSCITKTSTNIPYVYPAILEKGAVIDSVKDLIMDTFSFI